MKSYTEIESEDRLFGDNDVLSAVVAVLCRAKQLVILSDIDGLYDIVKGKEAGTLFAEKVL